MMLLSRLLMISFLILSRLVLLLYPLTHSACGRLPRDSFFRERVWHLYHESPYEDGIGKEHWFENGVKELRPGLHGLLQDSLTASTCSSIWYSVYFP